jgi:hypothetical protein
MNGPRSTGPEYTGKHRRDSGPGVLPPAWPSRSESYGRPVPDARPAPESSRRPEAGFRADAAHWPDAR